MALFVVYQHTNVIDGSKRREEYMWHLNERKPEFVNADSVYAVSATHEELSEILLHFKNIPDCRKRDDVTWRGDIAKFIWENI